MYPASRLNLWHLQQQRFIRERECPGPIEAMTFSRDDQWLAISGGKDVELLRVESAKDEFQLTVGAPAWKVSQLAFSPDGRQLACAAVDRVGDQNSARIAIFERSTRQIRLELVGHPTGIIQSLAYAADSGLLASGADDATAVVWQAGLRAFAETPFTDELPMKNVEAWYETMTGADAKAAFQAMTKLARAPKQTAKVLSEKIPPASKPNLHGRTINQWIGDLGSEQFTVRTRASTLLQKLGPAAAAELRAAHGSVKDIETRRRIVELLDRLAARALTSEEIVHVRAAEVLEALADAEARATLVRWAAGEPGAVLTVEARQALARLR